MKTAKKPTGYILYRGKSELNGKPIVVIAITNSTNSKTGNMVQTYIMADNGLSPVVSAGPWKMRPCVVTASTEGALVVRATLTLAKDPGPSCPA